MGCEAKQDRACEHEQQRQGLHQMLLFAARGLRIKVVILLTGVNNSTPQS
jgi:hypothetical protein